MVQTQGRVGTNTSYYGQGGKTAAEIKKAYGDSTGESSAIEIADIKHNQLVLPPDATASVDQAGSPGALGSGAGAEGEEIAGKLGDFMKANRSKIGVTQDLFTNGYQDIQVEHIPEVKLISQCK